MNKTKKVIVITGASSGLGKALAGLYAEKGHILVLSGRNEDGLSEFNNENIDIVLGDLTHKTTQQNIADIIITKHKRVDILINNAGVIYIQPFETNTDKQLDQIFEINVKSHIQLTQKLYPLMKQRQTGHIINIISSAGKEGQLNSTLYCATKFALSGFTESLRLEAKPNNIRVTGIYTGGMKTHLFDKVSPPKDTSKFMDAEDVAKAIVDLSDTRGISPDSLVISRM